MFSTVRSATPATTLTPDPASCTTRQPRVSSPVRANECPGSPIGVQPYSSIATRARVICGWLSTKCAASFIASTSGGTGPSSWANAYTVFFCVSVVSTAELSPVRWVAARSPDRLVDTFQSRITSPMPPGPAPRATRITRTSALPYRFAPSWTMGARLSVISPWGTSPDAGPGRRGRGPSAAR